MTRVCPRCNGSKITVNEAFTASDGTVYPRTEKPCYSCDGAGEFSEPNVAAIRKMIINPKSKKLFSTSMHTKAGRKRAAAVYDGAPNGITTRRAQYVWRIARFHSGADGGGFNLGGAVMADMDLGRDPFKPELDKIADAICDECYGKGANLRASSRWNRALHGY